MAAERRDDGVFARGRAGAGGGAARRDQADNPDRDWRLAWHRDDFRRVRRRRIKTALKALPPGPHGFHVHQNGSCQPTTANNQPVPAGAAGGHYDPQNTGKHEGPEGSGHLGDLPLLQVGQDGNANQNLTAPHIKDLAGLKGKAVVIHAGGDNYSDQPQPLGGGGGRIACGILE